HVEDGAAAAGQPADGAAVLLFVHGTASSPTARATDRPRRRLFAYSCSGSVGFLPLPATAGSWVADLTRVKPEPSAAATRPSISGWRAVIIDACMRRSFATRTSLSTCGASESSRMRF